jgi:hypothetical protein
MKAKKNINDQYANLCAQLGDLLMNKEKVDVRIADIKSQIEVLNKALPVAEEIERQLEVELAPKDKGSPEKDANE